MFDGDDDDVFRKSASFGSSSGSDSSLLDGDNDELLLLDPAMSSMMGSSLEGDLLMMDSFGSEVLSPPAVPDRSDRGTPRSDNKRAALSVKGGVTKKNSPLKKNSSMQLMDGDVDLLADK